MSRNFELLQKIEKEREANHEREVAAHFASMNDLPPRSGTTQATSPELEERPRKEITKLVERLFLSPDSPKAVVFSAADRGDGCSWVAARTAVRLAERISGSVCLLDANRLSPALHREFGVERGRLKNALSKTVTVRSSAQQLSPANLWLLGSELLVGTSEEMASSKSILLQIAELRREFDYVLIDTPPFKLNSDGISLAHYADGIVVVVSANSTRRDAGRQIARDLESSKVRVLGVVLNKRTFSAPSVIQRKLQQYLGAREF
jgi:Mrp family chromosome partitioning ATPase